MVTTHLILLFLNDGSGSAIDHFAVTLDMNTAMLLYLNDYYGTSYQDIQQPLSRYLQEGVPNIQAQFKKLERRSRGVL